MSTQLQDDTWSREIDLQALALAIARNRVGPQLPLHDVLAAEGYSAEYAELALRDPLFIRMIEQYVKELTESGFSFQAKCRVIAEDVLKTAYQLIHDPDAPAAVRMKGIENVVKWGDLEPKSTTNFAGGPGFSINIVLPGTTAPPNALKTVQNGPNPATPASAGLKISFSPQQTVDMAEISPENSPESCLETSEFTPIPADIDDSDAYEDDQ